MDTHTSRSSQRRSHGQQRGVWQSRIAGSFRRITVVQLAMAWWLYAGGHITRRQLRVYFAAHEMAERRRFMRSGRSEGKPFYGVEETKSLVGGSGSREADGEFSADIAQLARTGLVRIDKHAIAFAERADQLVVENIDTFWTMFDQLPHPRRSVPVPRRLIRALAAGFTRGMTAVVIATLLRSLFWHKEQGAYRVDGWTKREWITEVFGISPRTVTDARARLIELGWLVPLEAPQHMLNRYGTHDAINTDWAPANTQRDGGGEASSKLCESASLRGVFSGKSATPDLNRSLPLTGNQRTRRPAPTRAGPAGASRCSARKKGGRKERPPREGPSIRDIHPRDLDDTGRLLELHKQAVALGLARAGEGGRLDFVAMAERARTRGRKAGALLFWLLKGKKTAFITLSDEDRASKRLKEHLHGPLREKPRTQRGGAPEAEPPPSEEDRFVVACVRIAKQHRMEDPFGVARLKGWSRERWDTALQDYERRQLRKWVPEPE